MKKFLEFIEKIKANFQDPENAKEKNYSLLKKAIDAYTDNSGKIIREFIKQDEFLIIVWKYEDKYFVSNINKFFVEFDKYKFNDKNTAVFLFKDLTAFSEELSEI